METMLYEGGFTQIVLSIFIYKACTNSKHDSHCFTVLASHALKLAIRGDNMTQLASNLLWSAALIHFTKITNIKTKIRN